MGIDKPELYKVYKKSDTNVKTIEKKFKYKISYPHQMFCEHVIKIIK